MPDWRYLDQRVLRTHAVLNARLAELGELSFQPIEGSAFEVERPARHVQRLTELLGLVTCTTTARFRQVEGGTELRLGMAYRVAGGPIGRVVDSRVGDEMVTTSRRDLTRLKALTEEQAGIR